MSGTALEQATVARLAIAALIGLAVGLEREWSGHASGAAARFAGLRTFLMLGLLGGGAGLLLDRAHDVAGAVVLAGGVAISIAAYLMAVRRPEAELDGTTETAALVVLALGTLAGIGLVPLAAGAAALVVLALSEKARLHWLVRRIGAEELRAALHFAVLALVVLPLLPVGPIGGPLGIRPRTIWSIALLFSGLNFAGYLARQAVGPERGYGITGVLGGLVSSTAVTLEFSRKSRVAPGLAVPLAYGVIGACTVSFLRVTVVSTVLNPSVALALLPYLLPPAILGAGAVALFRKRLPAPADDSATQSTQSPLGLGAAIRMAVIFQIAMTVLALVRDAWGTPGVYTTAALLGLTDVDALTVSMSRADGSVPVAAGAHAIAIGILTNTLMKLTLSLSLGNTAFRRVAGAGLVTLGVGCVVGLWFGQVL